MLRCLGNLFRKFPYFDSNCFCNDVLEEECLMRIWLKLKNGYTIKIKGHSATENHFLREHTPLTLFTLLTLLKRLTLLEHGGSIGVEDEEDDEQEQGLMDGLREPTEVKKQDDDNRKESRSRRVGSSPQPPQPPQSPQPPHAPHHEIEEINHKKLLDEVEESTKAEDSQRKISRSESVTKEQSGQSNTSGKKLISIAGSLQLS